MLTRFLQNAGEGVTIALDSLRSNKLRSGLTILGVVIGVTTVMAIASLVQGIRTQIFNAISAAGGLLGALAMLLLGSTVPFIAPYVLAFAAGNFLYVAMADLIPHLHRGETDSSPLRQVVLIALGLLSLGLVDQILR